MAAAAIASICQKKDEIYGYQTLYRELGYYITRREQYERALKYFDEALKKTPDDKRALMGRSIARAKAVQYEGALDDINKALKMDPDDLVVLALKALNTYLSCDFEDALVQNLRNIPKRKKPDNFYMGVMHCNQAIENGIGERAGRPLRDHYKIIRKLAWKKVREAENPLKFTSKIKKKKKKKKNRDDMMLIFETLGFTKKKRRKINLEDDTHYPCGEEPEGYELEIRESLRSHRAEDDDIPVGKPFPYRPLQRYTTNIENFMAEKYLKAMYMDKTFLKTLKDNPGVKSPNKAGYKEIVQLAKDGYKTLSYKQELLRTRRPFYFIKYQETSLSERLKKRQLEQKLKIRTATMREANALLDKIKWNIQKKNTRIALELAENLKGFCDTTPKKYLPDRDDYLTAVYTLVGQAYLDLKRLNLNQFEWDQRKRIYSMLGMTISREPSQDSVFKQFKGVFVDWKKQIKIAENRLRKASSSLELTWLYHDLARYHSEIKQFELARVYARKCIVEAKECQDIAWIINAKMIITRINIQQHNRTDAKYEVNEAIELAKQLNDESLVQYLEKTLAVVEVADFDDLLGTKVVEKRRETNHHYDERMRYEGRGGPLV
ncbi:hypothetical protein MML48_4g00007280 [Holotrichia oblita]|uniref:Uncharacterized protein n=1 Tax=Holotrichia oblita TaxID=644536 RepID=A0ACB9T6U1_HOLOL|nr:hypothetical protein MML48_4g00007280 [Holotrichia oblita]